SPRASAESASAITSMHSGNVSRRCTSCSLRMSSFIEPISLVCLLKDRALIGIEQPETMPRRIGHFHIEQQQPLPAVEVILGPPLSHGVRNVQRPLECGIPHHVSAI